MGEEILGFYAGSIEIVMKPKIRVSLYFSLDESKVLHFVWLYHCIGNETKTVRSLLDYIFFYIICKCNFH